MRTAFCHFRGSYTTHRGDAYRYGCILAEYEKCRCFYDATVGKSWACFSDISWIHRLWHHKRDSLLLKQSRRKSRKQTENAQYSDFLMPKVFPFFWNDKTKMIKTKKSFAMFRENNFGKSVCFSLQLLFPLVQGIGSIRKDPVSGENPVLTVQIKGCIQLLLTLLLCSNPGVLLPFHVNQIFQGRKVVENDICSLKVFWSLVQGQNPPGQNRCHSWRAQTDLRVTLALLLWCYYGDCQVSSLFCVQTHSIWRNKRMETSNSRGNLSLCSPSKERKTKNSLEKFRNGKKAPQNITIFQGVRCHKNYERRCQKRFGHAGNDCLFAFQTMTRVFRRSRRYSARLRSLSVMYSGAKLRSHSRDHKARTVSAINDIEAQYLDLNANFVA